MITFSLLNDEPEGARIIETTNAMPPEVVWELVLDHNDTTLYRAERMFLYP